MESIVSTQCNQYLVQIQELKDERQGLYAELNQAESPNEKRYIRQLIRLINREIGRLTNMHRVCVENATPKPDLFCEKQTSETTLTELDAKCIEVNFSEPSLFQWAARIKNKGNGVAKGPIKVILGVDFTTPSGIGQFREATKLIPQGVEIKPNEVFTTEYMGSIPFTVLSYTFYVLIDSDQILKEQDESNNYYEYNVPAST